jgi:exodeoxyribonuclease VII large subunit
MDKGITVSQLNTWIKQIFDAEEMLHNIAVLGEISGIKKSERGIFFDLKDESAVIPCSVWGNAANIMYHEGKLLSDGEKVLVRGTVTFWNQKGKINFNITKCEKYGQSAAYLLFLQLQEKLKAEGLFDAARKRALPAEVKRIGVVTSKTGAVIHDIKNVIKRRNPQTDIVLIDTRVQGIGAEAEIASAIRLFNRLPNNIASPDVIIVARGGGSAQDLAAFNTEIVARQVVESKIPVISAVGHESDHTLIDFCSDLRAPTPSAAAELCVRSVTSIRDLAIEKYRTLRAVTLSKLNLEQETLLQEWQKLSATAKNKAQKEQYALDLIATRLDANNPIAILKKGFTHTSVNLGTLKTGDEFEIMYYDNDKIEKGAATWKHKLPNLKK